MDDKEFGAEDDRGYWAPKDRVSYGPAFSWPPQPKALVKWLFGFPGYFLPWNLLYALAAVAIWAFLTPPLEHFETLSLAWAGVILARNYALALAVYGAWHLWLYVWRKQDSAFKYNRNWPSQSSSVFLCKNQTYDNTFWTLASGVPIWTAYELLLLWAYANGHATLVSPTENPLGLSLIHI